MKTDEATWFGESAIDAAMKTTSRSRTRRPPGRRTHYPALASGHSLDGRRHRRGDHSDRSERQDLSPPPPTTEIEETPSVVMPTADDCTIDPLSIDDVLAIVEHPNASAEAPSYITYHTEKSPGSYDKSPGYTLVGSPPSRETLDAIAVDHREYVACAMTGDWFKVWAMSDPSVVYQDVVERLYPIYITRDEARSLLQELQANGKAGELPSLAERWGQFEFVTLVDPQPENSNHFYDVEVQLGTVMYDAQGRRVLDSEDPAGLRSQEEGRVDLTYVWSERHGRWLYFLPKWGPA